MDLKQGFIDILAKYGYSVDTRDPFSVMPDEVSKIVLEQNGRKVDILQTVKQFFNHPAFLCADVSEIWKSLLKDPGGYIAKVSNQLNTRIMYKWLLLKNLAVSVRFFWLKNPSARIQAEGIKFNIL